MSIDDGDDDGLVSYDLSTLMGIGSEPSSLDVRRDTPVLALGMAIASRPEAQAHVPESGGWHVILMAAGEQRHVCVAELVDRAGGSGLETGSQIGHAIDDQDEITIRCMSGEELTGFPIMVGVPLRDGGIGWLLPGQPPPDPGQIRWPRR